MASQSESPSFPDRQKVLCFLSSFISEHEKWLQDLLNRLGWNRESLEQHNKEEPLMLQCPFNKNHYVPRSSLEKHKEKCQYAVHGVDPELIEEIVYSSQPDMTINSAVVSAVKKYAKTTGATNMAPHDSLVSREHFASLEDSLPAPPESTTWKPPQIISYIKSWTMVPRDLVSLSRASINHAQMKGWLFKNLPSTHAHSSRLGGEMTTVESIMEVLESDPDQNISPNYLTKKLRPLVGLKSRQFVLDLWKFVHISRIQLEHSIPDSLLEDIAPMSASLLHQPKEQKEENPVISDIIETIAAEEEGPSLEPALPLPMDHVFYKWTTTERRVMYDYVVQKTNLQAGTSKVEDPDLYRDDTAAIKTKLKAPSKEEPNIDEEGLSHLEILKRKRDYKRRRQSYRAKNVHITQRTTAEVFRAIINNRMEEISAALTVAEEPTDGDETTSLSTDKSPHSRSNRDRSPDYRTRTQSPGYRRHSRHSERESEGSSRREHSHSHERHRHDGNDQSELIRKSLDTSVTRSKYKKDRDSGERSSKKHKHHSRSKDRSRSRSRERKHHHKKHKKQSRSCSRDRHVH